MSSNDNKSENSTPLQPDNKCEDTSKFDEVVQRYLIFMRKKSLAEPIEEESEDESDDLMIDIEVQDDVPEVPDDLPEVRDIYLVQISDTFMDLPSNDDFTAINTLVNFNTGGDTEKAENTDEVAGEDDADDVKEETSEKLFVMQNKQMHESVMDVVNFPVNDGPSSSKWMEVEKEPLDDETTLHE
ncbi:uncharacterized protein LOC143922783 [Arctopsyche grandis]|uniref:uncharacterized protein LOC143922783 n=1 Tax=Arctopsyche grandis TaxID=121162 RepID=UPI00406D6839